MYNANAYAHVIIAAYFMYHYKYEVLCNPTYISKLECTITTVAVNFLNHMAFTYVLIFM